VVSTISVLSVIGLCVIKIIFMYPYVPLISMKVAANGSAIGCAFGSRGTDLQSVVLTRCIAAGVQLVG